MKKILVTSTDLMMIQFLVPHVLYLRQQGYAVEVACSEVGRRLDEVREKLGAESVHYVRLVRSPADPSNLKGLGDLKRLLSENHYDLIWTNEPVMGIMTRLAAKKTRKKGTRVIYMAHGFHFYKGAPKKNWLTYYPVEKFFADHYTDTLITITAEDYVLASKRFHCKTEHIHGIGVDRNRYFPANEAERLRLRREYGFTSEQKLILNIGELLPNKNQKTAVRMMQQLRARYPDALLLIAGKGSEKENLERQIDELGLQENVRLLGYVTNLQDYQHMVDAVVTCSYREGLPLNVVESMLSGTPVVASLNRGHRELLRDGETGYLVPPDDAAAYAARLTEIFTDEEKKHSLTAKAGDYAHVYCFNNVKRELEGIYF